VEVFKGAGTVEIARRAWEKAVEVYHEVIANTRAAQESHARLESVLRATSGASGQTTASIEKLADEMARLTRFDDTAIRNAAAQLLTFDRVGGAAFERIIKLSADLAATGRGDLETWVSVLAKAGTEPAESIGLLERAFGKLDPVLKVQVRNLSEIGQKQQALDLLLDAVSRKVGGTAVDSYRGLQKQMEGTKKAWDDLTRTVGEEIFNAKSREVSVFESSLRDMADHFKSRMAIIKDAWNSLPAPVRALFGGGEAVTPQSQIASQLDHLRTLAGVIEGQGGNSDRIRGEIARLEASQRRTPPGGPDPWNMEPGYAAPVRARTADNLTTDAQKRELYMSAARARAAVPGPGLPAARGANQRELAQLEALHGASIVGDEAYYAKKLQLGEQAERDEIARLQEQVALQKKIQGKPRRAQAMRSSPRTPIASRPRSRRWPMRKRALSSLTAQETAAEVKLGLAAREVALARYNADVAHINRMTAIDRDEQDYVEGLKRQSGPARIRKRSHRQERGAQAAANVERKLTLELEDEAARSAARDRRPRVQQAVGLRGRGRAQARGDGAPGRCHAPGDRRPEAAHRDGRRGAQHRLRMERDRRCHRADGDARVVGARRGEASRPGDARAHLEALGAFDRRGADLGRHLERAWRAPPGARARARLTGSIASGIGSWLGSTALGTWASGVGTAFSAGFGGAELLAGGTTAEMAANSFGAALAEAMPALGIFALAVGGAAIAAGQFARGWSINNPGNRSNQFAGPADPAWFNSQTDRAFRGLGFNDQWAAILSGSSVTARLFGHQARQSTTRASAARSGPVE
jgi:hypothetical protein